MVLNEDRNTTGSFLLSRIDDVGVHPFGLRHLRWSGGGSIYASSDQYLRGEGEDGAHES
jgi:hypothetical protein